MAHVLRDGQGSDACGDPTGGWTCSRLGFLLMNVEIMPAAFA